MTNGKCTWIVARLVPEQPWLRDDGCLDVALAVCCCVATAVGRRFLGLRTTVASAASTSSPAMPSTVGSPLAARGSMAENCCSCRQKLEVNHFHCIIWQLK